MKYRVVDLFSSAETKERDTVYLRHTDWDDWFRYSTLYDVMYVDGDGRRYEIGGTKIGRFGLQSARRSDERRPGFRYPDPPRVFSALPIEYFSLGQDSSYYENLTEVGADFREEVLREIRDLAADPDLLGSAEDEDVTAVSLLREVPLVTVREQFARLAHGGVRLTPYRFRFRIAPDSPRGVPLELDFSVDPDSRPPTNVQVLIGRNGVGKSTLLNKLATSLVSAEGEYDIPLETGSSSPGSAVDQLSNLVSISFSAFDNFEPITVPLNRTKGLTYHYVGLKRIGSKNDDSNTTKDPRALAAEMTKAARVCLVGARRVRWERALRLLEADPIFADAGLTETIAARTEDGVSIEQIGSTFSGLSSGHKIVLLTITRLVETVEEKSLVLLDEPEAHLHPPLLSAFIRSLSDLLTNRNGMAIVATHSPLVLQEVPRSGVWKLNRSGYNLIAERPVLETFGENVGTLTDEVFGLEVTATGFHRMLANSAEQWREYSDALAEFDGQVGAEGRAILRAMIVSLQHGATRVGS